MKKIAISLLLIMVAISLSAQRVSVDELVNLLKDPKVILIDARPSADYLKTHINGAIGLDVTTLCDNSVIEGTLRTPAEMAKILGDNGIARNSKVVVYCKTGINAGRMYWLLNYLGCTDVSLLDGNMDAWFAARKPITKNPKKLAAVTFTPAVNNAMLVNKAYVQSKLTNTGSVLVDTRKKEDVAPGKIGNAINVPTESMIDGSKLKSVSELTTLFASVPKDKEVILYCKTGTSASYTYYVMKEILKYPNLKLYDGAYLDWTK